ncbi:MCE family protein [Nocardia uniformis]|uniref:MCE family protein n=1 Tax=Nocardia uniformis TaxID=53432 RepID=A0A849BXB4_9NOCA|nr:MlaD family protein [Nocardia uniformis]NNH70914.1 MCE family protein [Nocardia uniformis]
MTHKRTRYNAEAEASGQTRIGLYGVAFLVIVMLIVTYLFVTPIGEKSYVANFTTSGGARVLDEVRIAGIRVGRVRGVKLVRDHVEITFSVRRDVVLGDRTRADLELLTPVGGHFLALTIDGKADPGLRSIPLERTTVPYDPARLLEEAAQQVEGVDGSVMRASLEELAKGLQNAPNALASIAANAATVVNLVTTQGQQLQDAVSLADEYLTMSAQNRQELITFLQQAAAIVDTIMQSRGDIVGTLQYLYTVVETLYPPLTAYETALEPVLRDGEALIATLNANRDSIDQILTVLAPLLNKLKEATGQGPFFNADLSQVLVHSARCQGGC